MSRPQILVGKTFGNWFVVRKLKTPRLLKSGRVRFECVCKCGVVRAVIKELLTSGRSKSCGCWRQYKRLPDDVRKRNQRLALTKWLNKNPEKINYYYRVRQTRLIRCTPKWLTRDQRVEIETYYLLAKKLEVETGIKHHVDHIIPIHNKLVCGLHVPWNLQVITAEENLKKSNKLKA